MRVGTSGYGWRNFSDGAGAPDAGDGMSSMVAAMFVGELLRFALEMNAYQGLTALLRMLGGTRQATPMGDSFQRWGGQGLRAPRYGEPAPGGTFLARELQQPGGASSIQGGQVVPMRQGDYRERLGEGGNSIASHGCFLTSLAMAASVRDPSMNPSQANARVRAGGGFSGGAIQDDEAARALGMEKLGRTSSYRLSSLDQHLEEDGPVVAGVDYKDGHSSAYSDADHFITLTGKSGPGSYTAIDPASGREITLRAGADGRLHSGKYTMTEAMYLRVPGWDARTSAPADGRVAGIAQGTGYHPANTRMEGGYVDAQGRPLGTLQDYLDGRADYVSIALDRRLYERGAVRYGDRFRIPELERRYGRPIEFRAVDTGGAFTGRGFSRVDVCTRSAHDGLDDGVNGRLTLVKVD